MHGIHEIRKGRFRTRAQRHAGARQHLERLDTSRQDARLPLVNRQTAITLTKWGAHRNRPVRDSIPMMSGVEPPR
jgi:hypothetical protein